ncbi:MAG: MFS transporter, partial [Bdellovibrionaceae bacterium]|nr:MFS transporter [Pseudobdellovibrionaceae bacterium]
GVGASSVQIIVPFAAHLTPDAKRGQVVGNLMSGLMLGIMLSRPIASLLTDLFGWHAVFILSAGLMLLLAFVLYALLPSRQPHNSNLKYSNLIISMWHLFVNTPILQRRAIYQGCLFGSFCLFWTATPLLLSGPEFRMSQTGIAIFALVGVAGAISAPFAGKAADRGWNLWATTIAIAACSVSFILSHFFPVGSMSALIALVFAAILLDAGVTANLVLGQRAIFALPQEFRGRLNGLYIATIFVGGATGSALGAWAFATGGWPLTSLVGFALPAIAFAYFLTGRKVA